VAMRDALNKSSEENNYGYTTWTFWPPKSDTYIYEEVEKVWAKQEDPKAYLEGLQKVFDEELKSQSLPPLPPR
jgi:raffinose/stachyose/melibiose transport system substrate-binding protein